MYPQCSTPRLCFILRIDCRGCAEDLTKAVSVLPVSANRFGIAMPSFRSRPHFLTLPPAISRLFMTNSFDSEWLTSRLAPFEFHRNHAVLALDPRVANVGARSVAQVREASFIDSSPAGRVQTRQEETLAEREAERSDQLFCQQPRCPLSITTASVAGRHAAHHESRSLSRGSPRRHGRRRR